MTMPPRSTTGLTGITSYKTAATTQQAAPIQVSATRAITATLPFDEEKRAGVESLLKDLRQQQQQTLVAIVTRVLNRTTATLTATLDDTSGGQTAGLKPAFTLLLSLGGRQLSLDSEAAFPPGTRVALKLDARGQLLLTPLDDTPAPAPKPADILLRNAMMDTLRQTLPRQQPLDQAFNAITRLLAETPAKTQSAQTGRPSAPASNPPASTSHPDAAAVPSVDPQARTSLQRYLAQVPQARAAVQDPGMIRDALRNSGVNLEQQLAGIAQNQTGQLPGDVAAISRLLQALPASDTKALLLSLLGHWPAPAAPDGSHPAVPNSPADKLRNLLESALARIVVQQLQSASDDAVARNQGQPEIRHLHTELLLRHGEQLFSIPMQVVREPDQGSRQEQRARQDFVWQVRMDFDISGQGLMRAIIHRGASGGTRIQLQADNAALTEQIERQRERLLARLQKRGIRQIEIRQSCNPGLLDSDPVEPDLPAGSHTIDVRT